MGEPEVFISYSSKHYEEAKKLKEQLQNYCGGIEAFVAKQSLLPGVRWKSKLVDAIYNCKVFVLMLNEDSANSSEVETEVDLASKQGKHIFVLRTDNCEISSGLAYTIEPLQHFYAIPPDDNHFFEAVEAIAETLKQVKDNPDYVQTSNSAKGKRKRLPWRWILGIALGALLLIVTLGCWAYIHRPVLPEYDPEVLKETGQLVLVFSRRADMQNFGEGESRRPPWYNDRNYITSVIIPENARSISKFAFADCANLKEVKIQGKITRIGMRAFSNCTSLESVEFPDNPSNSLEVIAEYAFYACEALSAFDTPETLNSIGEHAFEGCHSLEKIDIPPLMTSIADSLFAACKHLKEVKVFGNVKEIGASAFYGTALECAIIPNSVEKIGEKAFKSCEKLSEIKIPDSVTEIGDEAFMGCSEQATIRLPQTFLQNVGKEAFPYDTAVFTFRPINSEAETASDAATETETAPEPVAEVPTENATETEIPIEPSA